MRLSTRSIPPQNLAQYVPPASDFFEAMDTPVAKPMFPGVHALYSDECCRKIAKQRRKNIKEMNTIFGYTHKKKSEEDESGHTE